MSDPTYGFIGAGRMASALAAGLVQAGVVGPEKIAASDPYDQVRDAFTKTVPGVRVEEDNCTVALAADVLVLAVKPQFMAEALESCSSEVRESTLVVSIAAGVRISALEGMLPHGTRVVRVMPNTPCLIGQGASGFSLGLHATKHDSQQVRTLLEAVGVAFELPEEMLDAVTGLSGSGPAFVYTVIEALGDAGTRAGLPDDVARQLACHTVAGAAAMVAETGLSPDVLREAVKSPGGTTVAGLEALSRGGARQALLDAVEAATQRSKELGQ